MSVYSEASPAGKLQIRRQMMAVVRASVLKQNRGRNFTFTELETIVRALVDEALAKETSEQTESSNAQQPTIQ